MATETDSIYSDGLGCKLCCNSREPGWLCAKHPGKRWGHGKCQAERAPCICNPKGEVLWGKLIAEFVFGRTLH